MNCRACYGPRIPCRSCAKKHCGCWWSRLSCRKAFREFLNATSVVPHRHNGGGRHVYQQRTRKYGDYLYAQDRVRFEVDFIEAAASNSTEFAKWLQSSGISNSKE